MNVQKVIRLRGHSLTNNHSYDVKYHQLDLSLQTLSYWSYSNTFLAVQT